MIKALSFAILALTTAGLVNPAAEAHHKRSGHGKAPALAVYLDVPGYPKLAHVVARKVARQTGRRILLVDHPTQADLVSRVRLDTSPPYLRPLTRKIGFSRHGCVFIPTKARLDYRYKVITKTPGRRGAIFAKTGDAGAVFAHGDLAKGVTCGRRGAGPGFLKRQVFADLADRIAYDVVSSVRQARRTAFTPRQRERGGFARRR